MNCTFYGQQERGINVVFEGGSYVVWLRDLRLHWINLSLITICSTDQFVNLKRGLLHEIPT